MRIPTRQRRHGLRFNITPLIDVVFQLIIFFLAATHFLRNETLEKVQLPQASQQDDTAEKSTKRLVVTVTADERFHVGGNLADLRAVEDMIVAGHLANAQRFEVRIRSDRSVPYRQIEPILLACARAGVRNVKFAVMLKM